MRLSICHKCGGEIKNLHGRGPMRFVCAECRRTPKRDHPSKGAGKGITFLRAALASNTDECILWPYSCAGSGYGHLGFNGQMWKAHVWVCTQAHGPRPRRRYAAHSCHKKTCVNPRHLSWKTNSENMLDKRQNGTANRCGFGTKGKLTPQQRGIIFALKGKATQRVLALQYGIEESTVRYIQNGKCKSIDHSVLTEKLPTPSFEI